MASTVEMTDRMRAAVYGRTPGHVQEAAHTVVDARNRFRWANEDIRRSTDSEWTRLLFDERSDAIRALRGALSTVYDYSPVMARGLLAVTR